MKIELFIMLLRGKGSQGGDGQKIGTAVRQEAVLGVNWRYQSRNCRNAAPR
jgi:hypothetical protein